MKPKLNKTCVYLCLICLLIAQIFVIIYWTDQKEGFHHDEIWTFQLSNALEYPSKAMLDWQNDYLNEWHESDYFDKALVASPEHLFSFLRVYKKQIHDVHPPLFYFGIHAVSSLFPGIFSKWLGIVPNSYFKMYQCVINHH